jgi:S-adenosylmethionine:tRNA ribosyltransferase-isomerase
MPSKNLDLSSFSYHLPEEKIAKYPLANRSDSKLLTYTNGTISHRKFEEIDEILPESCHLVFNDTKVIPARLIFHKETGARIEIFLLEPLAPSNIYAEVMAATEKCQWHCMIGNAKRWKIGSQMSTTLPSGQIVTATRIDQEIAEISWEGAASFSEIVTELGNIPLPPYLNREVEESDKPRYQTVYSHHEGAVAAPTAGLHFTEEIIARLPNKNITTDYLTLHVSAGTFQPIKAESVEEHPMHREQIIVTKANIEKLLNQEQVIAVGTTSMRTLESLYWYGVRLSENAEAAFFVQKMDPYQAEKGLSKNESLQNVLSYMIRYQLESITGHTEIFIFPSYKFRICKGIVTNFHLPGSTLILLIAALVGDDWKVIYNEALASDYRFLSYGDSSLLLPR